ncbi:MAG TPA: dTDP-4-dehydrorhamnose reductase [Steroidobacteraceae bacterium]|nr:dTDP-4-dehydrorhamnose reductase [Steroidobacteraceae bacterium]
MRVLVLGGGGQVARAVVAAAPTVHQVLAKTRTELDIGDDGAVKRALREARADWVVNAAAYTAVDLAEDQRSEAVAINDTAVGVLVEAVSAAGCRLLHLSTDFVFDGKSNRAYLPSDETNPLSVYGASKLGGERRVLTGAGSGVVLRTAWVYAAAGRNFVLNMLRLMREKEQVSVVCDQIGTPTWAGGIAGAIWGLIEVGAVGGVYHWTDLGVASWYDFAVAIQDEALTRGLLNRAIPIAPIPSTAYPTRARRPAFSVLDTGSTRALVKVPARHWRHNLRTMLDELRTP